MICNVKFKILSIAQSSTKNSPLLILNLIQQILLTEKARSYNISSYTSLVYVLPSFTYFMSREDTSDQSTKVKRFSIFYMLCRSGGFFTAIFLFEDIDCPLRFNNRKFIIVRIANSLESRCLCRTQRRDDNFFSQLCCTSTFTFVYTPFACVAAAKVLTRTLE